MSRIWPLLTTSIAIKFSPSFLIWVISIASQVVILLPRLPLFNLILDTAAKVILLKCKSDHINSLIKSSDGFPYHYTICCPSITFPSSFPMVLSPRVPLAPSCSSHTHVCSHMGLCTCFTSSPPSSLYSNVTFWERTSPTTLSSFPALFFSIVLLATHISLIIHLVSHLPPHSTTALTHRDPQNTEETVSSTVTGISIYSLYCILSVLNSTWYLVGTLKAIDKHLLNKWMGLNALVEVISSK